MMVLANLRKKFLQAIAGMQSFLMKIFNARAWD
jgi:hypothetical protein